MKGRLRSIFVMLFAFIILFQFRAYADYVTDIGTQNNNVQLSNDVTYEVRHFKMKLDGTYASVPDEIEVIAGNTGETKLPAPKDYTGFIMPATKSITLKYPSSTNFIEYKYQRHRYTVTFNKNAASATGTMTNRTAALSWRRIKPPAKRSCRGSTISTRPDSSRCRAARTGSAGSASSWGSARTT